MPYPGFALRNRDTSFHLPSNKLAPVRIFIDCTATHASTLQTGIERVVRNIAAQAQAQAQASIMNCQAIRLTASGYVPIAAHTFNRQPGMLQRMRAIANHLFVFATRSLSHIAPRYLRRYLLGTRHEPSLARLLLTVLRPVTRLASLLQHNAPRPAADHVITFQPGDILLLVDSVWNYTPWSAVQAAKASGAFIAAVVYDIIPVTHPQFFAPVSRVKFATAMALLVRHADAFLSISAFTEMQLRRYVQTQVGPGLPSNSAYAHFALGAELELLQPRGRALAKVSRIFVDRGPVYLAVGTLEPRKNHCYLLQSFQKLWDAGVDVSLLFVGRVGWMSEALVSHIKTHSLLGKRLFLLEDADDCALDYAYTHARAVLLASVVEGFGLPLIEALHKGRPVFASDIPVFREVGGDYPVYYDLSSPDALFKALLDYETTGNFRGGDLSNFTWPTWPESTRELLTKLLALHAENTTLRLL